jgi:hypothetical protein
MKIFKTNEQNTERCGTLKTDFIFSLCYLSQEVMHPNTTKNSCSSTAKHKATDNVGQTKKKIQPSCLQQGLLFVVGKVSF